MTSSNERPILFSGAMVRAILDGRKTQTRRVVTCHHKDYDMAVVEDPLGSRNYWPYLADLDGSTLLKDGRERPLLCPYGQPGDLLWVRETSGWLPDGSNADHAHGRFVYRADGDITGVVWKPSIHMPRKASRILLEVLSVRVERLNDCSDDDAVAEGVSVLNEDDAILWYSGLVESAEDWPAKWHEGEPVRAYRDLWQTINGVGSWDSNPWVWVVEFKRLKDAAHEQAA